MESDRRKPLGGVDKETYVHSAGDNEQAMRHAELTYNLLIGMKSDICYEMHQTKFNILNDMNDVKTELTAIKEMCACRVKDCRGEFIKKVHPKVPLSFLELFLVVLIVGTLLGLGYLEWRDIINIIIKRGA